MDKGEDPGDDPILQSLMKNTAPAIKPEEAVLPHDLQNISVYPINETLSSDNIEQNNDNKEKIAEPVYEDNLISSTAELDNLFQNSFATELPQSQIQVQNENNSCNVAESVPASSPLQSNVQIQPPVPSDINDKPCINSDVQQSEQNLLAVDQSLIDQIIGASSVHATSQNNFLDSNNGSVLNSQPSATQPLTINNTPNVSMRMDMSENLLSNKESLQFSSNPVSTPAVTPQEVSPVTCGGHPGGGTAGHQPSHIVTIPDIGRQPFITVTTQSVFTDNSQKFQNTNFETQSNNMIPVPSVPSVNLFGGKSLTQTSNSQLFQNPIQSIQQDQPSINQHLMNVRASSLGEFDVQLGNNPLSLTASVSQPPSTSECNLTAFQNKLPALTVMTSLSTSSLGTNTVQCVNSRMQTLICAPTSSHLLPNTGNLQQSSESNINFSIVCTSQSCVPENVSTPAPLRNVMIGSAVGQNSTGSFSQTSAQGLFNCQSTNFVQQVNSSSAILSNNPIPVQTFNLGNTLILAPVTPINTSNTSASPLILGTPLPTLMTPITSQSECPKSDPNIVHIINNVSSSAPAPNQMSSMNLFNTKPILAPRISETQFPFGTTSPVVSLQSSAALSAGTSFPETCSESEQGERIATSSTSTVCASADQSSLPGLLEKDSLLRKCLEGRIDFQTSTPNTHLSVSQASSPDNQLTLSSPDTADIPSPLSSPKVSLEHTTQHSLIDKSRRLHLNSETLNDEAEDPSDISIYYPEEGEFDDRVKVQKLKKNSDASSTFSQNINFNKLLDASQEEDTGAKKFSFFGFGIDDNGKVPSVQEQKNNTEADHPSQICSPSIVSSPESEPSPSFEDGKEHKLVSRPAKEYSLTTQFAYKVHGYELEIKSQPEEQHRARYQTEGSRGAVKDRSGTGHPLIKLNGCRRPAKLQVFIGCDAGRVRPHGFYQACKISGKNATPAVEREIEGTTVIEMDILPVNDMITSIDNVGILKLRNADVERRIGVSKAKRKSTKARMVFRVSFERENGSFQTLQICSTSILCTQPVGQPEICRMSRTECSIANTEEELFIIGKNFLRGTKVFFQEESESGNMTWQKEADVDTEHFAQTHLICSIPEYHNKNIVSPALVKVVLNSSGKLSEPRRFTYTPVIQIKQEIAMETDDYHPKTLPGNVSVSPVALEYARRAQESQQPSQSMFQLPPGTISSLTSIPTVGPTPMDQTQPQFDARLRNPGLLQPQNELNPTSSGTTVTNPVQPILLMSNGMNLSQSGFKLVQLPVSTGGVDAQPSQIVINLVPGNTPNNQPNIAFLQQATLQQPESYRVGDRSMDGGSWRELPSSDEHLPAPQRHNPEVR